MMIHIPLTIRHFGRRCLFPAGRPPIAWSIITALLGLFIALAPPSQGLAASKVTIKLGTLAPESSAWYTAMRTMGDRWADATNGKVRLKIYAGGVSGNEDQIIRKMRINQLQAGMITSTGLIDIERSALSIQLPMIISSHEELDYIMGKMEPVLNKKIEAQGFKVLSWGDAGWVYFFTHTPVATPEELKKLKLWGWEGDPESTKAFKKVGLTPVIVSATDVLPALQTGMIEGFPQTALAALSLQWFGGAKNMINLRWSPMVGATVMTMKAWKKIPEEYRADVLRIAREEGEKLKVEVRRLDRDAVAFMKKHGLQVVEPRDLPAWNAFAASMRDAMIGRAMDAETAELVLKYHEEYLAHHEGN